MFWELCELNIGFGAVKKGGNLLTWQSLYDLHSSKCWGKINKQLFLTFKSLQSISDLQLYFLCQKIQLTLFHHANVDAALETAGLAVAPVVFCDGAASIKRTSERGFTLHAAPVGTHSKLVNHALENAFLLLFTNVLAETEKTNLMLHTLTITVWLMKDWLNVSCKAGEKRLEETTHFKEITRELITNTMFFFSFRKPIKKNNLLIPEIYLKKPLQPSHVIALKWKPVALSPHTPQIRGAFRSNSWGPTTDVVTVMGSITVQAGKDREKEREEKRG